MSPGKRVISEPGKWDWTPPPGITWALLTCLLPHPEILSISDDDKQRAFSELEFLSRAGSLPSPQALLSPDRLWMLIKAVQTA